MPGKGRPFGKDNPSPGRRKGSGNAVPTAVKDMILKALDKAGGPDYLFAQSQENPTAFLTLVGKVLPLQVTGENGQPVQTTVNHIYESLPK